MYLINELDSTLYVLSLDDSDNNLIKNRLKLIQKISLLNNKKLKSNTNIHAAEIKLYNNCIYTSNRSENSINIYEIQSVQYFSL